MAQQPFAADISGFDPELPTHGKRSMYFGLSTQASEDQREMARQLNLPSKKIPVVGRLENL